MDDEKNRKTNDAAPENNDEQTGGGWAIDAGMGLALGSATKR